FQLVIAIVLRVLVPFIIRFGSVIYFKSITAAVIIFYIGISSTISIMPSLFLISRALALLTDNWIAFTYIPLLIFGLYRTYFTLKSRFVRLIERISNVKKELSEHWWMHFNYNDPYWPDLEKSLQCCGLEGPRNYLDYLKKIPKHCYNSQLITLGCQDLVSDIFDPLQRIGYIIMSVTLIIQLSILWYYGFVVIKKLFNLIGDIKRKKLL
ncbi:hypothetical protein KR009_009403, partial [Drosophila setifemur]